LGGERKREGFAADADVDNSVNRKEPYRRRSILATGEGELERLLAKRRAAGVELRSAYVYERA